MPLQKKSTPFLVPNYSLTGDLLSFLRCALQYRYHSGSSLPPSRPVQQWFGEFIHGVLESSFRIWTTQRPAFPWPSNPTNPGDDPDFARAAHDIGVIGEAVEQILRAQGKSARNENAWRSAYLRATATVNELGPHLFPLIAESEQRVIGTRQVTAAAVPARAQLYELHGIIDVLTNIQLGGAAAGNALKDAVVAACPGLTGTYEVIVDYKGSRRPSPNPGAGASNFWEQGAWQLQTYAWLRSAQANARPVAAAILIYVNELAPNSGDLVELNRLLKNGTVSMGNVGRSSDSVFG